MTSGITPLFDTLTLSVIYRQNGVFDTLTKSGSIPPPMGGGDPRKWYTPPY